ncbi:hypothetical protein Droror1_Dr00000156 [Drosera rotundifolia]
MSYDDRCSSHVYPKLIKDWKLQPALFWPVSSLPPLMHPGLPSSLLSYQVFGKRKGYSKLAKGNHCEHYAKENADIIIKSKCLVIFLGGSDTTTVTLTWALSLVLNNPQVLKKAHEELDARVGRDRQVNDSDTKNLVYLQAIIKETMRLYPAGPILAPRESVTDCIVAGYYVPACTRLMINLWKLQSDPKVWPNPSEFQPERFLTSHQNVDVRGQNFELLPFGSGKRICIGINFSLQMMALTLGCLLHSFHISLPFDKPIDMTESSGLSNLKATPLELYISPRLPPHVYSQIN